MRGWGLRTLRIGFLEFWRRGSKHPLRTLLSNVKLYLQKMHKSTPFVTSVFNTLFCISCYNDIQMRIQYLKIKLKTFCYDCLSSILVEVLASFELWCRELISFFPLKTLHHFNHFGPNLYSSFLAVFGKSGPGPLKFIHFECTLTVSSLVRSNVL